MTNILQETVNFNDFFESEEIIDGKIYKITNLITNKIYIGQTKQTLLKRWYAHIKGNKKSKTYILRAIRKYGAENFKIEQIDSATTRTELNQKEYEWIIKEDCLSPNGYNLVSGGHYPGLISEDLRYRMSQRSKLSKWFHDPVTQEEFFIFPSMATDNLIDGRNDQHKENNIKHKTGSHHSQKTKEAMILSHLFEDKEKLSKLRRERSKLSKWFHDPVTQEEFFIFPSMATDNLIDGRNDQHKERFNNIMKNYKHNDETKEKISNSLVGIQYFYNPDTNKQIRLKPGSNIPEGFIAGKVPIERKWFYNPITYEEILLNIKDIIPSEYIIGRSPLAFKNRVNKVRFSNVEEI